MAASVAQFAQVSDWFVTTTPKSITGLAWTAGDVIVVVAASETATVTVQTPTNANLTFSLQASVTDGGNTESGLWIWTATAGSSQSGQTISIARDAQVLMYGAAAWVITGASGSVANASADRTESAFTFAPTAGSVVIYGHVDWNVVAGFTQTTGSGTASERRDQGNVNNYSQYLADWAGVSSSSVAFGVTDYTGTLIGRGRIEVLGSGGTDFTRDINDTEGLTDTATPEVTGPTVQVWDTSVQIG